MFRDRYCNMKAIKRMRFIIIPFLLITPAFSKDVLYLKCKVQSDFLISDLTTSKLVEDRTIDDISILKIDLKSSTAHDARGEQAVDIVVKKKMALIVQRINDDEIKLSDDSSLQLIPPYPLSGTGEAVYKSKNRKANYTYQGSCSEVNASVFDEALSRQNLYR